MYHLIMSFLFYATFFLFSEINAAISYASLLMGFGSFIMYSRKKRKQRKEWHDERARKIEGVDISELDMAEGTITNVVNEGVSSLYPKHKMVFIETEDGREIKGYCRSSEDVHQTLKSRKKVRIYYKNDIIAKIQKTDE